MILAIYWYWPYTHSQTDEQLANVRVIQITRRTPAPQQTPAPVRTAAPVVSKSRVKVAPPHLTSRGGKNAAGSVVVALTPTPRPAATAALPAKGCANPNAPAGVSATPDPSNIAVEARASRVSGTAAIDVSLDPSGKVTDAKVVRSSGNVGLDASALDMARGATYTPQYSACKGIASTYTFRVKFVAW
ncbi:MAG TPA: TonB family protein [Candidatus Rubrimentiphilum sp.]|nr:TonB family protein [Candidatus Rubrimentiphilum sp.]